MLNLISSDSFSQGLSRSYSFRINPALAWQFSYPNGQNHIVAYKRTCQSQKYIDRLATRITCTWCPLRPNCLAAAEPSVLFKGSLHTTPYLWTEFYNRRSFLVQKIIVQYSYEDSTLQMIPSRSVRLRSQRRSRWCVRKITGFASTSIRYHSRRLPQKARYVYHKNTICEILSIRMVGHRMIGRCVI